jgi:release factor glutamine methyltransferase
VIWPDRTEPGDVYQPAEDSELLATAAREAVEPTDLVLDVGTGAGYVAGAMAETGARVVANDLNPHACRQARERYGPDGDFRDHRTLPVEVVRADLVDPFADGAFDVVAFNPPYLPTEEDRERDDWMAVALSGGASGRAVIDRFLSSVGRVLAPDGTCLVLASTLAGVGAVAERAGEAGFSAAVVREESFPFETLSVLKLIT